MTQVTKKRFIQAAEELIKIARKYYSRKELLKERILPVIKTDKCEHKNLGITMLVDKPDKYKAIREKIDNCYLYCFDCDTDVTLKDKVSWK